MLARRYAVAGSKQARLRHELDGRSAALPVCAYNGRGFAVEIGSGDGQGLGHDTRAMWRAQGRESYAASLSYNATRSNVGAIQQRRQRQR
jgi:hypothetical protein